VTQSGHCDDGSTGLLWGGYTRGTDVPALNCNGQVVGNLADALLARSCQTYVIGRLCRVRSHRLCGL